MFELFCWLTALVSLVGVVLNIYRHRSCFVLWSVTNAVWVAIDGYYGIYSQASLHGAYLILAIYGLWAWKSKAQNETSPTA